MHASGDLSSYLGTATAKTTEQEAFALAINMTADSPYETRRSGRTERQAHSEQAFGLRSHSVNRPLSAQPSKRRGSYYWHGQYYEIDDETRPEWIDAGRKDRRRSAATSPMPSRQASMTPDAQQPDNTRGYTSSGHLQPPAPTARMIAPTTPLEVGGTVPLTPPIPSQNVAAGPRSWTPFSDLPDELCMRIHRLTIPTGNKIELKFDPPFVREPKASLLTRRIRAECLSLFYAENEFRCPFHGVLSRFLKQLDVLKLRALRCVRLTTPLAHSGFLEVLFEKLLERRKEGLKVGAILVAADIAGEGQRWIAQSHLNQLEGVSGRWEGSGIAKRRPPPPSNPKPKRSLMVALTVPKQHQPPSPDKDDSSHVPTSEEDPISSDLASHSKESSKEMSAPPLNEEMQPAERRPQRSDRYYSAYVAATDELFAAEDSETRRVLSHVGRIEEGWGERAGVPCNSCRQNAYICMVYTEAARADLARGRPVTAPRSCARCMLLQNTCKYSHGGEDEGVSDGVESARCVSQRAGSTKRRVVYDSEDD